MFKRIVLLLVLGIFFALSSPAQATTVSNESFDETIEEPESPNFSNEPLSLPEESNEGLEFLMYNQNNIMAFAVIADHEKYQLRPILAQDKIPGLATVSQMNAPETIAVINASYFGSSGIIYGNTKIDGVTASSTYFYRSGIGIRADGSTIFGKQNYHGVLHFNDEEIQVTAVNSPRSENNVIIYNFWQGTTTRTNNNGLEIIVQDGVVTDIIQDKGNNSIPRDGYIISVHGSEIENFSELKIGDEIYLEENFINEDDGTDFNDAIHLLGAGPTLVKDGEISVTVDEEQFPSDIRDGRAPRSAVGVTQYGDYILAVVDGRQAHSRGCTLNEWAQILRDEFGAVEALNLDGGGSTELIVKGNIVNSPSDGQERYVGDVLAIIPREVYEEP